MKNWLLPAAFVAVALPTAVMAENNVYDPIKRADKMMKSMDKDHNGSVTQEEYLRPAHHRFKGFDTNKNGKVERQELYDFWKNKRKIKTDNINAWEGPTNAHFKKFDNNKDNVISKEEYFGPSVARFKDLDADANGVIDGQELRDHWIERRKDVDAHDFSERDDD